MDQTQSQLLTSLHSEHVALWREIDEFQRWWRECQEIGKPKFGEMGVRLQAICDRLAHHFQHEEFGGYLDPALQPTPQAAREAKRLRDQHAAFLKDLSTVASDLNSSDPHVSCWSEARQQFDAIVTRLRQHDADEERLFQSAPHS